MITGKTLIEWGFAPGAWFANAIAEANEMARLGADTSDIYTLVKAMQPAAPTTIPYRTNTLPFAVYLEPESELEQDNLNKVTEAMDALMRTPTVVSGVVMPDACPAGTIPVGGVVATKDAIHPGFHSADVCCSMAITVFNRKDDPKKILDIAQAITHFGPGGRKPLHVSMGDSIGMLDLLARMDANRFLADRTSKYGDIAMSNLSTQGDGNHFLFVGHLRSTGQPAIVTHHGSRGIGALLYKRGMQVAKRHTAIVSPRTPDGAAWIDATSEEGIAYWDALQLVREWTKLNHFTLHQAIARQLGNKVVDQFWNEHNFVFRRDDGLFYHAKGATPSFKGFSADDDGRTLIPMNMAEPILLARHRDNAGALGFSPHGAGRNYSRTSHMKMLGAKFGDARGISPRDKLAVFTEETKGLDIRAFLGTQDLSELPSAYKSAAQVQRQIIKHDLAEVYDYVDPYGSIMAGEMAWQRPMKEKR